jgi:hypothetical protein
MSVNGRGARLRPGGRDSEAPRICLARYLFFEVAAQILENLLFALLDFEKNGFGETQVILL